MRTHLHLSSSSVPISARLASSSAGNVSRLKNKGVAVDQRLRDEQGAIKTVVSQLPLLASPFRMLTATATFYPQRRCIKRAAMDTSHKATLRELLPWPSRLPQFRYHSQWLQGNIHLLQDRQVLNEPRSEEAVENLYCRGYHYASSSALPWHSILHSHPNSLCPLPHRQLVVLKCQMCQ